MGASKINESAPEMKLRKRIKMPVKIKSIIDVLIVTPSLAKRKTSIQNKLLK